MILTIPETVQKEIDRYKNLKLGDKQVRTPYYMNLKRSKDLRAMVGKGTPEEIEMEARIWEKLKGEDFSKMNEKEIRDFLVNRGIGIDCSGFIIHVLNSWHREKNGKNIWKGLKSGNKSFLHRISYLLKPVEKLGAEIITNAENTHKVEIKDVLPADVVRLKWKRKNSHHILLVTEVEKDESGVVKKIGYTHSIPFYGEESGIKTGEIIITDQNKPLESQNWTEKDEKGVNHVFEGYMIEVEDNGLRRLKCLASVM